MPTAVMTESNEKTMSSRRICAMIAPKETVATRPAPCDSFPSSFSWISITAL